MKIKIEKIIRKGQSVNTDQGPMTITRIVNGVIYANPWLSMNKKGIRIELAALTNESILIPEIIFKVKE